VSAGSFAGLRFTRMVLSPAVSKSVHLLFDRRAEGGCLSDEPIQVFNLPSQLLDIWHLGHVRIEISDLFRPVNSRHSASDFVRAGVGGVSEDWCARQDSNLRPLAPEANALSS
jgi:hypothetical protein